MKTNLYTIGAGLGLIALAGCSSKSNYVAKPPAKIAEVTIAAGKEAELWPMQVGNQWVYEAETAAQTTQGSGNDNKDIRFKVSKSNTVDGVTTATLDIYDGEKLLDQTEWRVDKTGVYQTKSTKLTLSYNPPQPIIKFPIETGKEFTYTGTGPVPMGKNMIGNQTLKGVILGPQEIDTASGRISAIAVQTTITHKKDNQTAVTVTTAWLVPGKGLVRYRQETQSGQNRAMQLFKLKDFVGSKS